MGPFSLAMVIIAGTFVAGLTFDIGLNASQNYYDVIYIDAAWRHRVADLPALREVNREELEADRLIRGQDFVMEGRKR